MPSQISSLTAQARLDALEILLRELLAFSLARRGVVDRARLAADALESEAALSSDAQRHEHAAEVRVAVARLSE